MPARRADSTYPFWVGLVALVGIGLVWPWGGPEAPPLADGAVADAGAPDAAPPPPPPPLSWTVSGRGLPAPAALGECLRGALKRRALVTGRAPRLVITAPGLTRPQVVAQDGADLILQTPSDADPRLSTALHTATAACLKPGAQGLRGPDGQTWGAGDWPQLGPSGGAPLGAFVQVSAQGEQTRSVGLARFGRPEVVARGATTEAQAAVQAAAVQLFIAQPQAPMAVRLSAGDGQLVATAPWWPGGLPDGHWGLAAPKGDTPWVPVRAARPPPAKPDPPRARPSRRRRTPDARRPRPPRRPATRAPVFLPDYR